ncbi:hypothetical protein, partial [Sphingorhabdus sp.]|uniref:hypothetical protein n=1 Tax=Sphingorhabdus sp. TaxID=1902408 RepID=UPI0038FC619E
MAEERSNLLEPQPLISVNIERDGERISVTETVDFEGGTYVSEYENYGAEFTILCQNLSIEHKIPKPFHSS